MAEVVSAEHFAVTAGSEFMETILVAVPKSVNTFLVRFPVLTIITGTWSESGRLATNDYRVWSYQDLQRKPNSQSRKR